MRKNVFLFNAMSKKTKKNKVKLINEFKKQDYQQEAYI